MIEYGDRARRLPAPPHVVWDDLVNPRQTGPRVWLDLQEGEMAPGVLESERPTLVVWSSLWLARPDDQIVMRLSAKGAETLLRFTLLAHGDPPDEAQTHQIRHRVNELLWADLRLSYDQ